MLRGMNWGCLTFLILFPAGIFIWARGEQRRRAALPPEELKKLEAEEDYGPIDKKLECIFCHYKNCVRTKKEIRYIEGGHDKNSPAGFLDLCTIAVARSKPQEEDLIKLHCINCGNSWQMFPPEETAEN